MRSRNCPTMRAAPPPPSSKTPLTSRAAMPAILAVPCGLLNVFSLDGTAPAAPVDFDADCALVIVPAPLRPSCDVWLDARCPAKRMPDIVMWTTILRSAVGTLWDRLTNADKRNQFPASAHHHRLSDPMCFGG